MAISDRADHRVAAIVPAVKAGNADKDRGEVKDRDRDRDSVRGNHQVRAVEKVPVRAEARRKVRAGTPARARDNLKAGAPARDHGQARAHVPGRGLVRRQVNPGARVAGAPLGTEALTVGWRATPLHRALSRRARRPAVQPLTRGGLVPGARAAIAEAGAMSSARTEATATIAANAVTGVIARATVTRVPRQPVAVR